MTEVQIVCRGWAKTLPSNLAAAFVAVMRDDVQSLSTTLRGGDLDSMRPDADGNTLWHWAVDCVNEACLLELLRAHTQQSSRRAAGAALPQNNAGQTPQHKAASKDTLTHFNVLIAGFGVPSCVDRTGRTVLHLLVKSHHLTTKAKIDALHWVLSVYSNASSLLSMQDKHRRTVLDYAIHDVRDTNDPLLVDLQLTISDFGGQRGTQLDALKRDRLFKTEVISRTEMQQGQDLTFSRLCAAFFEHFDAIRESRLFGMLTGSLADAEAANRLTVVRAQDAARGDLQALFRLSRQRVEEIEYLQLQHTAASTIQREWTSFKQCQLARRQRFARRAAYLLVRVIRSMKARLSVGRQRVNMYAGRMLLRVAAGYAVRASTAKQSRQQLGQRRAAAFDILSFWRRRRFDLRCHARMLNQIVVTADWVAETCNKCIKQAVNGKRWRELCQRLLLADQRVMGVTLMQTMMRSCISRRRVCCKEALRTSIDMVRTTMLRRRLFLVMHRFVEKQVALRTRLRVEGVTKKIGKEFWREAFVAMLTRRRNQFVEARPTVPLSVSHRLELHTALWILSFIIMAGALARHIVVGVDKRYFGFDLAVCASLVVDLSLRPEKQWASFADAVMLAVSVYGVFADPRLTVCCCLPLVTWSWRSFCADTCKELDGQIATKIHCIVPLVLITVVNISSFENDTVRSLVNQCALQWMVASATAGLTASHVTTGYIRRTPPASAVAAQVLATPLEHSNWLNLHHNDLSQIVAPAQSQSSMQSLSFRTLVHYDWGKRVFLRYSNYVVTLELVLFSVFRHPTVEYVFGVFYFLELAWSWWLLAHPWRHRVEFSVRLLCASLTVVPWCFFLAPFKVVRLLAGFSHLLELSSFSSQLILSSCWSLLMLALFGLVVIFQNGYCTDFATCTTGGFQLVLATVNRNDVEASNAFRLDTRVWQWLTLIVLFLIELVGIAFFQLFVSKVLSSASSHDGGVCRSLSRSVNAQLSSFLECPLWYTSRRILTDISPRMATQSRRWCSRARERVRRHRVRTQLTRWEDRDASVVAGTECQLPMWPEWSDPPLPLERPPPIRGVGPRQTISSVAALQDFLWYADVALIVTTTILMSLATPTSASVVSKVLYVLSVAISICMLQGSLVDLYTIVSCVSLLIAVFADQSVFYLRFYGAMRLLSCGNARTRGVIGEAITCGVYGTILMFVALGVATGVINCTVLNPVQLWTSMHERALEFYIGIFPNFLMPALFAFAASQVEPSLARGQQLSSWRLSGAPETVFCKVAMSQSMLGWTTAAIFTGIFYDHYAAVNGFAWNVALIAMFLAQIPLAGMNLIGKPPTRFWLHLVDCSAASAAATLQVIAFWEGGTTETESPIRRWALYVHYARAVVLCAQLSQRSLVLILSAIACVAVHLTIAVFATVDGSSVSVTADDVMDAMFRPFPNRGQFAALNGHFIAAIVVARLLILQAVAFVCFDSVKSWIVVPPLPRVAALVKLVAEPSALVTGAIHGLHAAFEASGALHPVVQKEASKFIVSFAAFLKWVDYRRAEAIWSESETARGEKRRVRAASGASDDVWFETPAGIVNGGACCRPQVRVVYSEIASSFSPLVTVGDVCRSLSLLEYGCPVSSLAEGRLVLWFVRQHIMHRAAERFQALWRMYCTVWHYEQLAPRVDTLVCSYFRKRFRQLKASRKFAFFRSGALANALAGSEMQMIRTSIRTAYAQRFKRLYSSLVPARKIPRLIEESDSGPVDVWAVEAAASRMLSAPVPSRYGGDADSSDHLPNDASSSGSDTNRINPLEAGHLQHAVPVVGSE